MMDFVKWCVVVYVKLCLAGLAVLLALGLLSAVFS